jgi:hypothetical protein
MEIDQREAVLPKQNVEIKPVARNCALGRH